MAKMATKQHGDSEVAKITPFAYQRLPSTKQPSWNSSNIILFQTIYALEQKLETKAKWRSWMSQIFPFKYQRWPCIKQPSWNSSSNFFKTICPLEQKPGNIGLEEKRYQDGQELNSNLNICQTTSCSKRQSSWAETWLDVLQAKKRLLNASNIPLRYKRWSCTKQPSCNFSNNLPTHKFSWAETYWDASCNMETQNK